MNLFTSLPNSLPEEVFDELLTTKTVRIERIVSKGHSSPEDYWYDQEENEWVVVIAGSGVIEYEDNSKVTLNAGDYVNIPARAKHRVHWTLPNSETIWLAIFY